MALLATQVPSSTGTEPTYAAATGGGDTMVPHQDAFLHVKNGSGGSITVTVTGQTACNQGSTHDLAVAVPAGEERMIGPVSPQRFQRDSDGYAAITYSGVTSLTVAAIRM